MRLNERPDPTAPRTRKNRPRQSCLLGSAATSDLVRSVADALVARQSPSLPRDHRDRIVNWMIHDPYLQERIKSYLEMVVAK
jgi:hypothetical protein